MIKPIKHLGQNFLQDQEVLEKIIAAADLKTSDTVLEVGPGTGILTRALLQKVKKVIAVEKDPRLYGSLSKSLRGATTKDNLSGDEAILNKIATSRQHEGTKEVDGTRDGLQLINQDILRFDPAQIPGDYKVVANIPYYLTSKLFQYFLEQKHQPKLLVLMVQKEVGERVVAKPGKMSVLGLSVQLYADVDIVTHVSKESFLPVPEVDSVVLRIVPKNKYPQIQDKKLFFRNIKIAFSGKRKQLKNTIKDGEALKKAGIDPTLRPQDLSMEDWIRLYEQVSLPN